MEEKNSLSLVYRVLFAKLKVSIIGGLGFLGVTSIGHESIIFHSFASMLAFFVDHMTASGMVKVLRPVSSRVTASRGRW